MPEQLLLTAPQSLPGNPPPKWSQHARLAVEWTGAVLAPTGCLATGPLQVGVQSVSVRDGHLRDTEQVPGAQHPRGHHRSGLPSLRWGSLDRCLYGHDWVWVGAVSTQGLCRTRAQLHPAWVHKQQAGPGTGGAISLLLPCVTPGAGCCPWLDMLVWL